MQSQTEDEQLQNADTGPHDGEEENMPENDVQCTENDIQSNSEDTHKTTEIPPKLETNQNSAEDEWNTIHRLEEKEDTISKKQSPFKSALSRGVPKRYVLLFLVFLGFVNIYGLRINLNVALVAMVNNRTYVKNGVEVKEPAEFHWNSKTQGDQHIHPMLSIIRQACTPHSIIGHPSEII